MMIDKAATMPAIKTEVLTRNRYTARARNRGPRIVAYIVNVIKWRALGNWQGISFESAGGTQRDGLPHAALRSAR